MSNCRVCGRPLSGQKCSYDGFVNTVCLDEQAYKTELKRAAEYRGALLSNITDFSVEAKTYQWDSKTLRFAPLRTFTVKIADGATAYGKKVWADQPLGQCLADTDAQPPVTLEISYRVKGTQKTARVEITPVVCEDFWKIGIEIAENLTFKVLLGTPGKYAASAPVPLAL